MLITKAEAARRAGVSPQAVQKWENMDPYPGFFTTDRKGRVRIETEHPEWDQKLEELKAPANVSARMKKSTTRGNQESLKKYIDTGAVVPEVVPKKEQAKYTQGGQSGDTGDTERPGLTDLQQQAAEAYLKDTIYAAKIKEEKSKQEELKTAEIKKDLAPIDLVKHFFSFAEGMIQRIYSRPFEIYPELKALVQAGQDKEAVNKIIAEMEGIVRESQKDLIRSMEQEGYKKKVKEWENED